MRFREFSRKLVEDQDEATTVAAGLADFLRHRWHDFKKVGKWRTDAFITLLQNWGIPVSFESLKKLADDPNSPLKNLISNVTQDEIVFKTHGDETDAAEAGAGAGTGDVGGPSGEIRVAQMANRAMQNTPT